MNDMRDVSWQEANQRYLAAALDEVREALRDVAVRGGDEAGRAPSDEVAEQRRSAVAAAEKALPAEAGLQTVCDVLRLGPFDRQLLLLCAGVELAADIAALCAEAQGASQRPFATFGLALAAFPEAAWASLSPAAPLRYWRLIGVEPGTTLTSGRLSIDERILHFLTGVDDVDERLADIARPVAAADELPPSHDAVARRIAETWARTMEHGDPPVVQLCGSDAAAKQAVASAACGYLGMSVLSLSMRAIPAPGHEAATLVRLCEREALLSDRVLLLDCDDVGEGEPHRDAATDHFIETIRTPLIVSLPERRPTLRRPALTIDVERPTVSEQRALWHESLGIEQEAFPGLADEIEGLVAQFHLNLPTIRGVCAEAMGILAADTEGEGDAAPDARAVGRTLWHSCRRQARPRLDDLAQRIEPGAGWDDLVLPEAQRKTLWEIAVHVRRRATVYERWGFGRRNERGLGITALFSGSSGTGKTMAAEVLAADLMLDLYRIDLSAVVSKYIGETEKNLRRVFDTAEQGGAILLFDEADALFGKRSDVKDSHDRFANIEVSYLLQRMEAYRGLAILTTNLKEALDKAFVRRLRFIVDFPFPDAGLRADIWRHAFPPETPTENLDPVRLGRLNVAGGNIRNIALAAAFLAAEDESAVTMAHLLRAARGEYDKLGRQITDSEVRGWR